MKTENIENETAVRTLTEMPKRTPVNGTFELTVRCNLHCKMCLFRHDDKENPELMKKELTAVQWIDMAKQVAQAGTFSLLITGGEPMIRPDFCEIWEGIYQQGFIMELYTNATMVTPKIMETLRRYPPHKIGITLYGASPESYESVCGNGLAFLKALEGGRQLVQLPSIMQFRTTIIRDNYHEIDAIETLVHSEFGSDSLLTQARIVSKGVRGACADVESCRLSPEDNVKLAFRRSINRIKDCVGDRYNNMNLHLKWQEKKEDGYINKNAESAATLFGCNAGMTEYVITWDGKLLGCQMLGAFQTNAQRDGFQKAWKNFPFVVVQLPQNEKCSQCSVEKFCNSCVASRLAETGTFNECPEYFYQDAEVIQKMLNEGVTDIC